MGSWHLNSGDFLKAYRALENLLYSAVRKRSAGIFFAPFSGKAGRIARPKSPCGEFGAIESGLNSGNFSDVPLAVESLIHGKIALLKRKPEQRWLLSKAWLLQWRHWVPRIESASSANSLNKLEEEIKSTTHPAKENLLILCGLKRRAGK